MKRLWAFVSSTRVRALLSLGMVLGLGAVGTLAAWSQTATATSGVFTTGLFNVKLSGSEANPTPLSLINGTNVYPGDSVSAIVTVQNAGNLPLYYTMFAKGAGTFTSGLTMSVYTGGTSTGTACTGGTAIATAVALTTADAAIGVRTGPLAATGSNALCVVVTLSSTAPNTVQGQTGTALLRFDADA
ncbi:SipW-dependent-type signal peptide-containing protein [Rhodococcoides kyotonense]|uniref:SipW-cognate class signal peptide n=1 Tax=Rhodococcoides kyotonense TaxID=398843 RepID=A0A239J6E0_9NOCA|nr:SipW-dependent-type signal peptide-containing protein [Rhodococcus kyotonensis]SNT01606.1 SipW-cognate class signal peptide [Rhodococcus kyotonensis]